MKKRIKGEHQWSQALIVAKTTGADPAAPTNCTSSGNFSDFLKERRESKGLEFRKT